MQSEWSVQGGATRPRFCGALRAMRETAGGCAGFFRRENLAEIDRFADETKHCRRFPGRRWSIASRASSIRYARDPAHRRLLPAPTGGSPDHCGGRCSRPSTVSLRRARRVVRAEVFDCAGSRAYRIGGGSARDRPYCARKPPAVLPSRAAKAVDLRQFSRREEAWRSHPSRLAHSARAPAESRAGPPPPWTDHSLCIILIPKSIFCCAGLDAGDALPGRHPRFTASCLK